jgi:predicted nucleic acid-binding protein
LTAFADSSALVKLYADEFGCEQVRALRTFVASAVARVEIPAALWRKSRTGELSAEHASLLTAAFESDWYDVPGPFAVVAANAVILDQAAQLTATRSLRAYDAVQLASALAARSADPAVDTFACFDGTYERPPPRRASSYRSSERLRGCRAAIHLTPSSATAAMGSARSGRP